MPILPALLHTAVLALLSASTPLAKTLASTILVSNGTKEILRNPTLIQIQEAKSVHVFAFSSFRELLIAESEGDFSMGEWEQLYEFAEQLCCGVDAQDNDPMEEGEQSMQQFMQTALKNFVEDSMQWKI